MLLAMFFVAATLTFVSCGDKEEKPVPQPEPTPVGVDLSGASWECQFATTTVEQGISMNIDFLMILDFFSKTEGEIFCDMSLEVPDYPNYNQVQNYTDSFTYFFDGETLTLTDEEGTPMIMTYNAADSSFVWHEDDMEEILNTDALIFNKKR